MKRFVLSTTALVGLCVSGCWATSEEYQSSPQSPTTTSTDSGTEIQSGHYELVYGRDVLIQGKVYPLCTDLLKNFNSFTQEPPMVCERKFNRDFGFAAPDWTPVNVEDIDWEVLRQIVYSRNRNRFEIENMEKHWHEEKLRLQHLVNSGETILWKADFNIDNEGGSESVTKLVDDNCSVARDFDYVAPDPSLHVTTEGGKNLDSKYKRLDWDAYDTFLFQNHTYLSKWQGERVSSSDAQLSIYDVFAPLGDFGVSNSPVCQFKYVK